MFNKPKAREIKFPKPTNFEMVNKCLVITYHFSVEKEHGRGGGGVFDPVILSLNVLSL